LEDKVYLDFSAEYHSALCKLAAMMRGIDFRAVAKLIVLKPPQNYEDARLLLENVRDEAGITAKPRKTLISVPNLPLNFMGNRSGNVLLQVDRGDLSRDEIWRAFYETLAFPILHTDIERKKHLILCAITHQDADISGVRNPLRLLGTDVMHIFSQKVFDLYCQHIDIAEKIGDNLLKTLRDKCRHSSLMGFSEDEYMVTILVNTWHGQFHQVAAINGGELGKMCQFAIKQSRDKGCAILSLDYFVEDADVPTDEPFYLALAVSCFPLLPKVLPTFCRTMLVHRELFTDQEWRQLGLTDENSMYPRTSG
jgi:hypothetical protein